MRLGNAGSTGAPTTCAGSSSISGIRVAMSKPCMKAKTNRKMQTLHSALKKHRFMTAHAHQAVACLVTTVHHVSCCLHHIILPHTNLKCIRTAKSVL